MMILAWMAIGIPGLIFFVLLMAAITDGFENWENLIGVVIFVVMVGLIVSMCWGCSYVMSHKTVPITTTTTTQTPEAPK